MSLISQEGLRLSLWITVARFPTTVRMSLISQEGLRLTKLAITVTPCIKSECP